MIRQEAFDRVKRAVLPITAIGTTAALAAGCGASNNHEAANSTKTVTITETVTPEPHATHRESQAEKINVLVEKLQAVGLKAAKMAVDDILKGGQAPYKRSYIGVFPSSLQNTEAFANYTKSKDGHGVIYVDAISMPDGKAANVFNETKVVLKASGKTARQMDAKLSAGQLTDHDFIDALNGDVSVSQATVTPHAKNASTTVEISGANLHYIGPTIMDSIDPPVTITTDNANSTINPFLSALQHTAQQLQAGSI